MARHHRRNTHQFRAIQAGRDVAEVEGTPGARWIELARATAATLILPALPT